MQVFSRLVCGTNLVTLDQRDHQQHFEVITHGLLRFFDVLVVFVTLFSVVTNLIVNKNQICLLVEGTEDLLRRVLLMKGMKETRSAT